MIIFVSFGDIVLTTTYKGKNVGVLESIFVASWPPNLDLSTDHMALDQRSYCLYRSRNSLGLKVPIKT